MTKLHLLREGTSQARVASSFDVSIERVKSLYGTCPVISTTGMPTFNQSPANPVSEPRVAVIELLQGELAFGSFRSPSFNILKDVDAAEAYKCLVEQKST